MIQTLTTFRFPIGIRIVILAALDLVTIAACAATVFYGELAVLATIAQSAALWITKSDMDRPSFLIPFLFAYLPLVVAASLSENIVTTYFFGGVIFGAMFIRRSYDVLKFMDKKK